MVDMETLLTAGAAAGAIASIYKIYRPTRAFLAKVKGRMFAYRRVESQVSALTVAVTALSTEVHGITKMLYNNGGSSIKDALDRIEARQNIVEQRQRVQLSDTVMGVQEMDPNGVCTWVNPRICILTGRIPDDLLGYGWRNTIAPDERERILREWDSAIKEQRGFERYYHIQTPSGERLRVYARTQKLTDGKGQVAGWVKTIEAVRVLTPDFAPQFNDQDE